LATTFHQQHPLFEVGQLVATISQEANLGAQAIAKVLGGPKVLGKVVSKPDDLANSSAGDCLRPPSLLSHKGSNWETEFSGRNWVSLNASSPVGSAAPGI
jgi:hypothetical protein